MNNGFLIVEDGNGETTQYLVGLQWDERHWIIPMWTKIRSLAEGSESLDASIRVCEELLAAGYPTKISATNRDRSSIILSRNGQGDWTPQDEDKGERQ